MMSVYSDSVTGLYSDLSCGVLTYINALGEPFFLESGVMAKYSPEDGEREKVSCEKAFGQVKLDDYFSGNSLRTEWEQKNGKLAEGCVLVPITPFVLGGEFEPANLHSLSLEKAASFYKDLRDQIKGLPDGAKIEIRVTK